MVKFELMKEKGILIAEPHGPLSRDDFANLAAAVDPFIEQNGELNGLMLCPGKHFPGWENFSSLLAHFKFVRNHHRKVKRIAAVTDNTFLAIAPDIAKHFVKAEIKHFSENEKEKAMAWLEEKQ